MLLAMLAVYFMNLQQSAVKPQPTNQPTNSVFSSYVKFSD